MRDLIDKVGVFGDKFLEAEGADAEKLREALAIGQRAVSAAAGILEALETGNKQAFQSQLTEWADVNRTYVAIGKMDRAIEDAEASVQLQDVLDGVGTVFKIVATIGSLVP